MGKRAVALESLRLLYQYFSENFPFLSQLGYSAFLENDCYKQMTRDKQNPTPAAGKSDIITSLLW